MTPKPIAGYRYGREIFSTAMMTIGVLSRRSGVPVKALREYEDMGLIYAAGRSPGNYRLFDEDPADTQAKQTVGQVRRPVLRTVIGYR